MQERSSVRIVLLNPINEILLIKIRHGFFQSARGSINPTQPFWITPGGKIEDSETHEMALLRELEEETGISKDQILTIHTPAIWYSEIILEKCQKPYLLKETFYLVKANTSKITQTNNPDEVEKEYVSELRWWKLEDLILSKEIFFPKGFPNLLPPLFKTLPNQTIIIEQYKN